MSGFCDTCNGWMGFTPERHTCPPRWDVRDPEYDAERVVYAADAGAAVERAAEDWLYEDAGEGPKPDDRVRLEVRPVTESDSAPWVTFWVWYELVPSYDHKQAEEGEH